MDAGLIKTLGSDLTLEKDQQESWIVECHHIYYPYLQSQLNIY